MKCFDIQPFSPTYDARFADTFEPAIQGASLKAYRVDRDPSVSIPIEEIESNISSSTCCFADISEDNPNVWFELGYAIALQKPICIVCSDERSAKFPFDVQHRSIIRYGTKSRTDYAQLESKITARLKAIVEQASTERSIANVSAPVQAEGTELDQHELSCLALLAGELLATDGSVVVGTVRESMNRAGYTDTATALALHSLQAKNLVERSQGEDWNGNVYAGFTVTPAGYDVLGKLRSKLALTQAKAAPKKVAPRESYDLNDDIPF